MEIMANARDSVFETEAEGGRVCNEPKQPRSLWNKYSSVNADRSNNRGLYRIATVRDPGPVVPDSRASRAVPAGNSSPDTLTANRSTEPEENRTRGSQQRLPLAAILPSFSIYKV